MSLPFLGCFWRYCKVAPYHRYLNPWSLLRQKNGKESPSLVHQVPSNYAPNYPIGHPRRNDRSGGYSTLPHPPAAAPPPPQVGMVHPIPQQQPPQAPQGSYTPPPPPPHMEPPQYAGHSVSLPREYCLVLILLSMLSCVPNPFIITAKVSLSAALVVLMCKICMV